MTRRSRWYAAAVCGALAGAVACERESVRPAPRSAAAAAAAAAYKTVDVLLLSGDTPPVYQEGTAVADLGRRPWRPVKPGTADSIAFGGACALLAPAPGGRG